MMKISVCVVHCMRDTSTSVQWNLCNLVTFGTKDCGCIKQVAALQMENYTISTCTVLCQGGCFRQVTGLHRWSLIQLPLYVLTLAGTTANLPLWCFFKNCSTSPYVSQMRGHLLQYLCMPITTEALSLEDGSDGSSSKLYLYTWGWEQQTKE